MPHSLPTGEVARVLGTTEPILSHLVRHGRISPVPVVTAGRRAWTRGHILQAAIRLGIDLDAVHRRLHDAFLGEAFGSGPAAAQQTAHTPAHRDESTGGAL